MKLNATTRALLCIAAITTTVTLSSCFTGKSALGTRYAYTYALIGDNTSGGNFYSDSIMIAAFTVSGDAINFEIKNKSSEPMRIDWDEASIILYDQSKRIMHNGIKYADRNSPQAPSVIPGNASLNDMAVPTDNVYYLEPYYSQYVSRPGGWKTRPLFTEYDGKKTDVAKMIMDTKGTKFKLFMPILHRGVKKNYTFEFQVTGVSTATAKK